MSRVNVVTHVHWDREWYRTFDGFRVRLVELVDAVLDQLESGELTTFLLDGQTCVVDDYLEVRPDARDRLADHVAAGRLRIGPWYVLADKTLVSGEALVRNLLVGTARATELGGRTDVGYCPDMFGHPPDLPMVLRGFGIGTAIVWRGAHPDRPFFRWRAPDGSEVLALRERYYEPGVLWAPEGADERLAAWLETQRDRRPDGPWLLLNGGDHLAPRDLRATLERLSVDVPVRESTLEDHLAALDADGAPTVTGALRHPGREGAFLLAGTLSVRPRAKRANADAQALLEGFAEPLVARAGCTTEPSGAARELATTPTLNGLLHLAWRHLLQSHPHDSVCGCATDTVAADVARRYRSATEVGEQAVARAASRLGLPTGPQITPHPDVAHVAVFNATGRQTSGRVQFTLALPEGRPPVRVVDVDGTALPFVLEPGAVTEDLVTDVATLPAWPRRQHHRVVAAVPAVPASGWTTLRIELSDRADPEDGQMEVDEGSSIVGGRLTAHVDEDGSVALIDLRTGISTVGVGRLVDTGDRGDTYNHDAPLRDREVVARPVEVRRHRSAVAQELHIRLTAPLPCGLTDDRDGRETTTVPLEALLVARLTADADQLELDLTVDTEADDHRLRMHVPVASTTTTFVTDSGFTWQEHDIRPEPSVAPDEPDAEAEPGTEPTQRFVASGGGNARTAVLVHGTPEVAALPTDGGTELAITVVRAVGQLGRHDLRSRTLGAGPPIATPDAQEHGTHRVRCAVRLGDTDDALVSAAWRWRTPLRALQLSAAPTCPRTGGVEVTDGQLSAWKPAADGDGWVVRVANPLGFPRPVAVRFPVAATVTPCRLDEAAAGPATDLAAGTALEVDLAPGGLASWRVQPSRISDRRRRRSG